LTAEHSHAPLLSATEKALMVRLAVMLALHYHRCQQEDPKSYDEDKSESPISSILQAIITAWRPSEAFTEMEQDSDALRVFYSCALLPHEYTSTQEALDQAVRLVDCFEDFSNIRRLCDQLSRTLIEYAKHCSISTVSEVLTKILKRDQPKDSVISPSYDLSQPLAIICNKTRTEIDRTAALDVLRLFQNRDTSARATQTNRSTGGKSPKLSETQWTIFYELFQEPNLLRDGLGPKAIASFLRNRPGSEERDDALFVLAELSGGEDLKSSIKDRISPVIVPAPK
jgi:hypothetical protein